MGVHVLKSKMVGKFERAGRECGNHKMNHYKFRRTFEGTLKTGRSEVENSRFKSKKFTEMN